MAKDYSDRPRCSGTTTDGTRCENYADSCPWHNVEGEKPKNGRNTKLSHELQERLATDLEAGVPVCHAAPKNGISEDTYYRWLRRGEEQDEGLFSDFSERVSRAEAHGKASLISDAIRIARKKDDARALLKAYQHITNGEKAHEEEEEQGIPLVVPDNAIPDDK